MSFKGIKCEQCGCDIGCPHCGQLMPDLSIRNDETSHIWFCSSKCEQEYKRLQQILKRLM